MDDERLRLYLVYLLRHAQDQERNVALLTTAVGALTNALREASGEKFSPLLQKHQALIPSTQNDAFLATCESFLQELEKPR